MKYDHKEMKYRRLELKDLNNQFQKRIEHGMGCSPFIAEAITNVAKEIYLPYLNAKDCLTPGKIYFQCISKKVAPNIPISESELVTVILTLYAGDPDLNIRKRHGIKKLRQIRILRMCTEAYNQGGLLTVEDLAYRILNVGERTIVRDLSELRKGGENPPLRSTIKDMGKTVSHRTLLIKNWLKGDELSDLQRKYNHSLSAIENYINTFKRVIFLNAEGKPVNQAAYITKISVPLAEAYIQLWEECTEIVIDHRKKEILEIIGTVKKTKKRKKKK